MRGWLVVACVGALAGCSDEPEPCACRGDESCVEDVCIPWQDAPLAADFELSVEGRAVACTVVEGGFPRAFVDAVRFDFGDGAVGYGEALRHEYATDGVYTVDLVVRLRGYRELRASRLAVVGQGSSLDSRARLTIDGVPDYMNGSVPYDSDNGTPGDASDDYSADFHLLVPDVGVDVEIELIDAPGAEIDLASISLTADRALGDGALPAGTDLADRLIWDPEPTSRVRRARWTIGADARLPTGLVSLTLAATDGAGSTHREQLAFEAVELTAELDPLDRPMVWLMRFDMDLFSIAPAADGGVSVSAGPDGEPDFAQELAVIGATGEAYRRWVIGEILGEIYRYYLMDPTGVPRDRIAMTLYADGAPGAPAPADFATDGSFSMLRFGGSLGSNFGRSLFAPHNEARVDDTTANLGVATASIIDALATTAFVAEELFPIYPGIGVPVGDHPADPIVLAADFDRYAMDNTDELNRRYDELAAIARQLGQAIGAVAAHEMGHAMGLVPNDAPPAGFFGDRGDVTFVDADRTDSHHVDFPFLNLMQAGGNTIGLLADALESIEVPDDYGVVDMVRVLALENRLSPYARAYFQRSLTYGSFDTP